jgi:glycerate kinase
MAHYAALLSEAAGRDLGTAPYGGAAGGTGAALLALGATPLPGAATVARLVGLARALDGAALLITGEGRLDVQTLHGKAPQIAALEAWRRRVPVVVLVGQDGPNYLAPYGARLFLAHPRGTSAAEVRRRLPAFLREAAADAVRALFARSADPHLPSNRS